MNVKISTENKKHPYQFATNLMQFLIIPTFVIDSTGKVIIWNRACEQLTGCDGQEMLGTDHHWQAFYTEKRPCLCDLILRSEIEEISEKYASPLESSDMHFGVHVENWCSMPKLGIERYLSIDAGPLFNDQGELIAVVETISDMTSLKRAHNELEQLVMLDPLTRILNRRGLDQRLNQEVENAAKAGYSIAVLMMDIDNFKHFNDQHGHQSGDDCLRHVAETISQCARSDDIVARYGGEEFCVVIPRIDEEGAYGIAQRIREFVKSATIQVEGTQAKVTLSIGLAMSIPGKNQEAVMLLARADKALYQAKLQGRDRVIIS